MCGILGTTAGPRLSDGAFATALATLAPRGPDDSGTYSRQSVLLGHRRLSILDLTARGHQPMTDSEDRASTVFNGEIYNCDELREELQVLGHRFLSRTDTEVVLASFIQWGIDAFRRFNGIFACALLDHRDDSLTLVRDRLGVKPLYFHTTPAGDLSFASEIKALLRLQAVARRIDRRSLHEFLYFGVAHGQRTMFEGIERLDPGSWLRWHAGKTTAGAYWRIEEVTPSQMTFDEAKLMTVSLLRAAVGRQLMADVPVGCFLSGGVDSTAIATFAAEHGARLDAFTAAFDHQIGNDEVALARGTAARLGLRHEVLHIEAGNICDLIPEMIAIHDEPFADAANIPLVLLSQALKGRIKVVLQGDGGDELFAGYKRYSILARLSGWKRMSVLMPFARIGARWSQAAARLERVLGACSANSPGEIMARLMTVERPSLPPDRVLSRSYREELHAGNPFDRYARMAERFRDNDPVQCMLKTDLAVILPDIFLEKVDRATMACGIEARVPFLDNDLVEHALSLPSHIKMPEGRTKGLLRDALAPHLDPRLLEQPKSGFGVPFARWLRKGPVSLFAEQAIRDPRIRKLGIFDDAMVEMTFGEHRSGRRDHGFLLWKCMNLALWIDRYHVA